MDLTKLVLTPGRPGIPRWALTGFVDEASGEVFVPAALGPMNERAAMLAAGFDGESILTEGGHVYVRLRWLESIDPGYAETWDNIRRKVGEALGHA